MSTRADDLFEQLYAVRGSPVQIDGGIGSMAVTIVDPPRTALLWVPVRDPERLAYMLPAAQHRFIGRSAQGPLLCAAYTDADVCPLPRLYSWTTPQTMDAGAVLVEAMRLESVAGPFQHWTRDDLAAITPTGDPRSLLAAFNRARWAATAPALHEYLQGRRANTSLRGAVYSHTYQCLVHTAAQGHAAMMTLLLDEGAGALIVDICEECRTRIASDDVTTLEYLSRELRLPPLPFALRPMTRDDLLSHAEGVMVAELGCDNVVLNDRHSTLSGDRASGFTVKIRIESLSDYAYMLEEPPQAPGSRRKVCFRFDAAPDHPKVPFGPHHLHPDTRTRKGAQKNIAPSFLFGLPRLDVPAFLREMLKYEAAYQGQQGDGL